MWHSRLHVEDGGRIQRITLEDDAGPVAYSRVIDLWRHDTAFCDYFVSLLSNAPFDAYFWETPPINRYTVGRAFEMVLADSPALSRVTAQPGAFAEHFEPAAGESRVAAFPNLGGDAYLVTPYPGEAPGFPHIAAFSRAATAAQQREFWSKVGESARRRLSDADMWISTSGLGVYWLHVRLDTRPKYYTYLPYRDEK